MLKRKTVILLTDKFKIVNAIMSDFNLPDSSLHQIIKNKFYLKLQIAEKYGNIIKMKIVEVPIVKKYIVGWINQTLDKNSPIDGTLLKEFSNMFAIKLRMQNFLASNVWLDDYKRRHAIYFMNAVVESKSVDQGVFNLWIKYLPSLLIAYHPNFVFKCLRDRTFTFKMKESHVAKN